jgi:hypothetical protein
MTLMNAPTTTAELTLSRIPQHTDLVGYDAIIEILCRERIDKVDGDLLEIGCFLGGGTAKLAQLADVTGKHVWVIDVFDPDFDHTKNLGGIPMAEYYQGHLQGANQEEIFHFVTRHWSNRIRVIKEDSMKVQLPKGTLLSFGFADGNHDPAWVKSDFRLIWKHLSEGGWAGFHDYGGDLPQVTAALDEMLREHHAEIDRVERIEAQWVLLVRKRKLNESGLDALSARLAKE